jgi:hypothetical protein
LSPKSQPGRGSRRRSLQTATEHSDTEDDDSADEKGDLIPTEHNLRKRTLQQTNPFKFDKHKHLAQKTGQHTNTKKIENEVQQEIEGSQKQPVKKKARVSGGSATKNKSSASVSRSHSTSKARPPSSVPFATASPEADNNDDFDPARTVLRVRLDGFAGAAAPIPLIQCDGIDKLMDFIVDSWEWSFNGKLFSYAVASFSWLSDKSNILLRPGMEASFQLMVSEIEHAPVWREGHHAKCEVDVTVYVQ